MEEHVHQFNTIDRCIHCGERAVVLVREYLQSDHDLDTRQEVISQALKLIGNR